MKKTVIYSIEEYTIQRSPARFLKVKTTNSIFICQSLFVSIPIDVKSSMAIAMPTISFGNKSAKSGHSWSFGHAYKTLTFTSMLFLCCIPNTWEEIQSRSPL